MRRIMLAFGTRPEVIKLAPLIRLLREDGRAEVVTVSTGQHRALLQDALSAFDLAPDHDLALMREDQKPSDLMGRALLAIRALFDRVAPDVIVVQGDTTSVAAAAMAGFLNGVRVAHVEAGLRTGDKRAPFPEEVNRRVTSVVADDHFAPTSAACDNLRREGIPDADIHLTGNTVVDALLWMRERTAQRPLPFKLNDGERLALLTAHRRENHGERLMQILAAVREIAAQVDDLRIVFPVHRNPAVQRAAAEALADAPRVERIDPLGYADFVATMTRACLILTDSGGVQEEAPALGIPTLVLRDKTERPEGVELGAVKLVGADRALIVREALAALRLPAPRIADGRPPAIYGDGLAARRIAEVLIDGRMRTAPFQQMKVEPAAT